jgi:hypothetical protein
MLYQKLAILTPLSELRQIFVIIVIRVILQKSVSGDSA